MLYSKTAKYAILALAEIARQPKDEPVATRQIAEASGAPYPLLAKIVGQLQKSKLIHAVRGKQGGVRLAQPAEDIAILDVVVAMDGSALLEDCPLLLEPCNCDKECTLHSLWYPARNAVLEFLEKSSIQDVADARAGLPQL